MLFGEPGELLLLSRGQAMGCGLCAPSALDRWHATGFRSSAQLGRNAVDQVSQRSIGIRRSPVLGPQSGESLGRQVERQRRFVDGPQDNEEERRNVPSTKLAPLTFEIGR